MSELFVCPDCGSPLVEFSYLAGGAGECRACQWKGKKEDLISVAVHDGISTEEALKAMREDLRKVVSTNAIHFLRFLAKWGFVSAVTNSKGAVVITNEREALRYMTAIAHGIFNSVIEERKKVEVERVRAG